MGLAVALGVGLLLGIERERHKGRGAHRGPAGVRTFALTALLGALCIRVGGAAVLAAGVVFVGLAALAGYERDQRDDPGLTTAIALVVTFLLGALAQQDPALAAGVGTGVALLLAYRSRLHHLVRDTLTEREVHDVLLFAAAALIVLPLVPDEGIGPNDAFNPFTAWRLVVLVLAVNGAGYFLLRAIGPRYGLAIAGLLGGFASSTATIATMGRRAVVEPEVRRGAVAGGAMSTVATMVFTGMVAGAADGETLRRLTGALALGGVVAALYGAAFAWRAARRPPGEVRRGRAFDLRIALAVAGAISALLVISAVMEQALGRSGVVLTAALAGFADAQAAAASSAALAASGQISADDAALAILVALSTNTMTKAAVALAAGRTRYAVRIWPGLALVLGAVWLGAAVAP
ncbi:MAG: MgtC/SapB family protein [Solirubrobacterales bacterium]|nr:MgtC/SapB family protein [Solirubrobacterales bacterium]